MQNCCSPASSDLYLGEPGLENFRGVWEIQPRLIPWVRSTQEATLKSLRPSLCHAWEPWALQVLNTDSWLVRFTCRHAGAYHVRNLNFVTLLRNTGVYFLMLFHRVGYMEPGLHQTVWGGSPGAAFDLLRGLFCLLRIVYLLL